MIGEEVPPFGAALEFAREDAAFEKEKGRKGRRERGKMEEGKEEGRGGRGEREIGREGE